MKSKHCTILVLSSCFLSSFAVADIVNISEISVASGEAYQGYFGETLASDGDTLVVGQPGLQNAIVYEYDASSESYVKKSTLVPSDQNETHWFGASIAVKDRVIVVGDPGHDGDKAYNSWNNGKAYIFYRPVTGIWQPVQHEDGNISVSGLERYSGFGTSVAIDGNLIVVSKVYDDGETPSAYGEVYIYRKSTPDGVKWSSSNTIPSMTLPEPISGDTRFGFSMALEGTTLVVGAPFAGTYGEAYIYENADSIVWDGNDANITLTPTGAFNGFGAKVALDGDTIAISSYVGRRENYTSSPVTVFVKPQTGWQDKTEDANLTDTNSATNDGFGMGLDVFGDIVAVGSPYDDVDGDRMGSTYLYHKPETGWQSMNESAKLTASDRDDSNDYGMAVALENNRVMVGAPQYDRTDPYTSYVGKVYQYDYALQYPAQGVSPALIMYLLD